MVKRTTAFLFILLANIILLAHAVVPHHHINSLPSLVSLHGHQQFINRSNSHRVELNYLDVVSSHPYLFTALPDKYGLWNNVKKTIHFVPTHLLRSDYADYVNRCSGLRAPPLV